MLTLARGRRLFAGIPAALLISAALAAPACAQEISGLEAAVAMEQVMIQAIARAEKSVVAIARIKSPLDEALAGNANPFAGPGVFAGPTAAADSSPDFIPSHFGTGVVVDGRKGLILTNYHVIDDNFMQKSELTTGLPTEESIVVWAIDWKSETPNPRFYRAKVKAADPRSDLAVLEIDAGDLVAMKFAKLADPVRELKKGTIAIALGNPYAIARDGSVSASWGIISNVARKLGPELDGYGEQNDKPTLHHFGSLIQTDAKLNLGTSGGALVNLKGEMIGLTTSAAALSGFEKSAGFAVPVDDAFIRVIETLKSGREVEYGFLGVRPRNLKVNERRRGIRGMVIEAVQQGTPAAGRLQVEDVILAVNGRPIFESDGLILHVGKLPVGAVVRLTVAGKKNPVEVPLAKYPVRGRKIVTNRAPDWRGLRVDYSTADQDLLRPSRNQYTALIEGCVLVTDVVAGSPAAEAGLQAKNLITHVDNVRVRTPEQFHDLVSGKRGDVRVRLGDLGDEVPEEQKWRTISGRN